MKNFRLMLSCLCFCSAFNVYAQTDSSIIQGSSQVPLEQVSSSHQTTKTTTSKITSTAGETLDMLEKETNSKAKKVLTLDELRQNADNGDTEAQLDLGYMYLYGVNGVKVDYAQALHFYQMAAEKKSAVALNNLGSLYFNGLGTKVDYKKAMNYFEEAARLGSNDAAVNLAIIYLGADSKSKTKQDFDKVFYLLNQAQSTNNSAKFLLGYAYYTGFFVERDYNKAFKFIKAAADAQYDEAQLIIADFYIDGLGTPKNYSRAVQYLDSASKQGNSEALMRLADIYMEGELYTKDIKKAYVLYNVASVLGIDEAAEKRDALEKNLNINDVLQVQAEAENYKFQPSDLTVFIRKTFGNSLRVYIDSNQTFDVVKSK